MSVHATVFEMNPETGELSDRRDMPTVASALLRRAHPQLADYDEVNELDPIRTERLSLLSSLPPDVSGALVSLPRVRKWNAVVCRPAPDGNHFYSAHWALDAAGATLALILDFAAFA